MLENNAVDLLKSFISLVARASALRTVGELLTGSSEITPYHGSSLSKP